MPALGRSRGIARALALTAAASMLCLVADSAAAKPKTKKLRDLDQPVRTAVASHRPEAWTADRPRFFTINDVLAKRAGQHGDNVRLASLGTAVATDSPPASATERRTTAEPFGLFTFRAPEGLLWTKWRRIDADMDAEATVLARCRDDADRCSRASAYFLRLVAAAQSHDGAERIAAVNRSVNAAIRYTSDLAQHGVPDRWTSPLATLATGAGDCEDYAILKYAVLRESGVAPADLRLLLVRDLLSRQDHAVLAVRHQQRWLVLDNRWSTLMEASELARFLPLFAIDQQGVSLFAAPYAAMPTDPEIVPGATTVETVMGAPSNSPSLPLLL
jgi:predicted transglutaminase-like cysteine proteinase